jgi:hypothetical protein
MKKLIALLLSTIVLVSACKKPETASEAATEKSEKAEITNDTAGNYKTVEAICEKHLAAMSNFDTVALAHLLNDSVQYIGTDPSEIWGKAQIITYMHKADKPGREPLKLTLVSRNIKVLSGTSVVVTEHLINESLSKSIQSRITYLVNYSDCQWTITYVCWSLAPKNEDLKAIDKAVKVL